MAVATLSQLVTGVRAEAGHALTATQGLNGVETLKHLIQRTEYELWTAFQWPTLEIFEDLDAQVGQYIYDYPPEMGYDQIRQVLWSPVGSASWQLIEYGIPHQCILPGGGNSTTGPTAQYWKTQGDTQFRIWPTPSSEGVIRLVGMVPLNPLIEDDDLCTLDPVLITLFVSSELLTRAKATDASAKEQKAQRHLKELLGNKISAKNRVSTMGATRRPGQYGLRAFIDYIP